MHAISLRKRRRRRGLSMTEMIVTVILTSVAMVGGVKIMSLASHQCRTVDNRRLAGLEAGNVLEQVMARPWEEIVPGEATRFVLSDACRQTLPDAKLRVAVEAEAADPDARRITVEVDWQATALRRSQPVRLVAWRYLNKEARP